MDRPGTIIFLGDGMADVPVAALGGRTPLQAAHTPAMDRLAREGRCGTLFTLPDDFPTGSEVANMSVLGCSPAEDYRGRGPLEAAGRAIALQPDDIAFRINLTSVRDGVLKDYSAGHLAQEHAQTLVALLNERLGDDGIRFHSGVSYRNLLVLSGPDYSDRVRTEKPDDHQGERVADHLPEALAPEAEATVALLRRLMTGTRALLESAPVNRRLAAGGEPTANGLWPWSGGRAGAMRTLAQRYGISSAVISAVDVISGLGRCLGMDVLSVPGATGYIDTNYEGKADAAVAALADHDLVYLHVESTDEVSHERDLQKKIRAIEDFDRRVIGRVLDAAGPELNAVVLPDHPAPVALGRHTRDPVPVAVRMAGAEPDAVRSYDEAACRKGALGAMAGPDLMNLLFGPPAA